MPRVHTTVGTVSLPIAREASDGHDSLVVIQSEDAMLVGKRIPLRKDHVTVGRGEQCDIELDDQGVSRHHFVLDYDGSGWTLTDQGSTNGTFINEAPVGTTPRKLSSRDQIRVHAVMFKYLWRGDLESEFHEKAHLAATVDALTGLITEDHFVESVNVRLAASKEPNGGVIRFELFGMSRIVDVFGSAGTARFIKRSAELLWRARDRTRLVGRFGQHGFALFVDNSDASSLARIAKSFLSEFDALSFELDRIRMRVRVCAGCAGTHTNDDCRTLLHRSESALWEAVSNGPGSIVVKSADSPTANFAWRRVFDARAFMDLLSELTAPRWVLAFKFERDLQLVEEFGLEAFESCLRALLRIVMQASSDGDILATWRDEVVLLGLSSDSADSKEAEAQVRRAWVSWQGRNPVAARSGMLRVAFAEESDIANPDRRVLAYLSKKLQPASTEVDVDRYLPFPIALLSRIPRTRRTSFGRAKAMAEAIETTVQLLAAISVCVSLEAQDQRTNTALVELARTHDRWTSRPLSFGDWVELLWRSAAVTCNDPSRRVVRVLQPFIDARSKPSPLCNRLFEAVKIRNVWSHERSTIEDGYEAQCAELSEILKQLLELCRPLSDARLVSVASVNGFEGDRGVNYDLCLHRGPMEHFPVVKECLSERLELRWCYLLEADSRSVLLAPFVGAIQCNDCRRIEFGLARKWTLGPKGEPVELCGLTTGHRLSVDLPWPDGIRRLWNAFHG